MSRCMFLTPWYYAKHPPIFPGACMLPTAVPQVGGSVPASTRGDLLEEVTNLVESPTTVMGSFAADFLALPR